MKPSKVFFVGIDSDGCVFDTMEIKHKECFVPQFIKHFDLQAVSKYARQTWEFVNLYSKTRGTNRFPALSRSLNLLREREEVLARGVVPISTEPLDRWVRRESRLGNAALEAEVASGNRDLERVLIWSKAVNASVAELVKGIPPFPLVRESLERISIKADTLVVSQTPIEALQREWREHRLDGLVQAIAGQEMGTKTQHLEAATRGKYPPDRVLLIGDAPGDYQAAKANQALFYPILPGQEEISWKRLYEEALDRFFAGRYAGDYQAGLNDEFDRGLPEQPPW